MYSPPWMKKQIPSINTLSYTLRRIFPVPIEQFFDKRPAGR
jgi:hypothetical protein